jgi:hypothetical protein
MLVNPHVETTAQVWPNSQELKDYLSIPLALALQPLAHDHAEGSIPAEELSSYRCQSCKAFINQLCFIRSERKDSETQMSTTAQSVAAPISSSTTSTSACPN